MGKGGGKTQTVTNETKLPEWVNEAGQANYARAQQVANRPYVPYAGNMLAGFTPMQEAAMQQAANSPNFGGAAMLSATNAAQDAANYRPMQVAGRGYAPTGYADLGMGAANAGPAARADAASAGPAAQLARGSVRDVAAQGFLDRNVQNYMNPYIGAVIDNSLRDLSRQNDITNNTTNARAAAAGAFGGSRQAVANTLNNEAFLRESGNLSGNLRHQGYNTAAQLIQQDNDRALQAAGMNQTADYNVGALNTNALNNMAQYNASNRQNANLANMGAANQMAQYNAGNLQQSYANNQAATNAARLYNAQAQNAASQFGADQSLKAQGLNQAAGQNAANLWLSSANALNGMGLDQQTWNLKNVNALSSMGAQQQAQEQARLTNAYSQWAAGQDYPLEQLNILQSGLTQSPYGKTTVGRQPVANNTGQNMLMGGLGGAALGNMLGGGLLGWTGVGGGAGALLGLMCWVARAAYGADNPRWLDFREWMLRDAPPPLYRAYLRHGPAVGRYIADKPRLRLLVRGVMEAILRRAGR